MKRCTLNPHAAKKAHWTGNGTKDMNDPIRSLPMRNNAIPVIVLLTMTAISTVVCTRM
jgi:hypothetical protein